MRFNICMPNVEGNFKVLCGFETEHLTEEVALELTNHVAALLLSHPEICFKDLVMIKWDGDSLIIDKDEVEVETKEIQ